MLSKEQVVRECMKRYSLNLREARDWCEADMEPISGNKGFRNVNELHTYWDELEQIGEDLLNDVATHQCTQCGEYFTKLEIENKNRRDEPCLNCGNYNYKEVAHV